MWIQGTSPKKKFDIWTHLPYSAILIATASKRKAWYKSYFAVDHRGVNPTT
jgi:hypothetical protein